MSALQEAANQSQAALITVLTQMQSAAQVTRFRRFFSVNAISVAGSRDAVAILAAHPEVVAIEQDPTIKIVPPRISVDEPRIADSVVWNVEKIRAPRVWNELGYTGVGARVAGIDTGVRYTHISLFFQYACPQEGPHTSCWFDAVNGLTAPYDDNVGIWHGTHTMGTAVGIMNLAAGLASAPYNIGVAPRAKWIACKGFDSNGNGTGADILACSDFLMAPGGNPANAPDVINNSWAGNFTSPFFMQMVNNWVAADIFPAFANGNSGPACGTAQIPASYAQSFGVGATDMNDSIASFSGRGPSQVVPSLVKPDVTAPGVSITSSTGAGDFSFGTLNGTSMATPHVTGTVALLRSKNQSLTVAQLRNLLTGGAIFIPSTQCGTAGPPNNVYGWGRIDAYNSVSATPNPP